MGFYKQAIYGSKRPLINGKPIWNEAPTSDEIVSEVTDDEAFQTAVRNAKHYDYIHYEKTAKEIVRLTVRYWS